jgi:phenylpyruvate tautomerase PptA (4-oxalocrotonate tautomerase family)
VTTCVADAVFPLASLAVHVTRVVPIGKLAGALLVTVTAEQLSVVVGVPRVTPVAKHPELIDEVTAAGAEMVGDTRSITVTVCVAVEEFPAPSVTVQVTVVVPIGNEAGALFVTEPAVQLSDVKAFPMLAGVTEHVAPAGIVMLAGATNEGAP